MSFQQIVEIARNQDKPALEKFIKEAKENHQKTQQQFKALLQQLAQRQGGNDQFNFDEQFNQTLSSTEILELVEKVDDYDYSPVAFLLESNEAEAANFLIENGASVAWAVYHAALTNKTSLVKELMQRTEHDAKEVLEEKAVSGAAEGNHGELLRDLLTDDPENKKLYLALEVAGGAGHFDLVENLMLPFKNTDKDNFQAMVIVLATVIMNKDSSEADKLRLVNHFLAYGLHFPNDLPSDKKAECVLQLVNSLVAAAASEGYGDLVRDLQKLPGADWHSVLFGAGAGGQMKLVLEYLLPSPTLQNFAIALQKMPQDTPHAEELYRIALAVQAKQSKSPLITAIVSGLIGAALAVTTAMVFTSLLPVILGSILSALTLLVAAINTVKLVLNHVNFNKAMRDLVQLNQEVQQGNSEELGVEGNSELPSEEQMRQMMTQLLQQGSMPSEQESFEQEATQPAEEAKVEFHLPSDAKQAHENTKTHVKISELGFFANGASEQEEHAAHQVLRTGLMATD